MQLKLAFKDQAPQFGLRSENIPMVTTDRDTNHRKLLKQLQNNFYLISILSKAKRICFNESLDLYVLAKS